MSSILPDGRTPEYDRARISSPSRRTGDAWCLGRMGGDSRHGGVGQAADSPDLKEVDRRAPKEPAYTSKRPLYGLLVFGPEAKPRVWMVLDRSKPDAGPYDVLYVDLDADGDLTEPGSAGRPGGRRKRTLPASGPEGPGHRGRAHEFHGPGDRLPRPHRHGERDLRGKRKMGGGYPEDPENGYLKFGDSPANVPGCGPTATSRTGSSAGTAASCRSAARRTSRSSSASGARARTASGRSRSTSCQIPRVCRRRWFTQTCRTRSNG